MKKLTLILSIVLVGMIAGLTSAAEKRIDVGNVITKADAETALGEAVKDGQPRNSDGADGYYSRCNYYSQNPGKSLVLRVRQAAAGQLEPKKQLESMMAENAKLKGVSGLGDKAAALNEGAGNGLSHTCMLYVAKGNAFVTVGVGGVNDEKAATEKATKLAKKILGQL